MRGVSNKHCLLTFFILVSTLNLRRTRKVKKMSPCIMHFAQNMKKLSLYFGGVATLNALYKYYILCEGNSGKYRAEENDYSGG